MSGWVRGRSRNFQQYSKSLIGNDLLPSMTKSKSLLIGKEKQELGYMYIRNGIQTHDHTVTRQIRNPLLKKSESVVA